MTTVNRYEILEVDTGWTDPSTETWLSGSILYPNTITGNPVYMPGVFTVIDTVVNGGQVDVYDGGVASDTVIISGVQDVNGTAIGTVVSGGSEAVLSGGVDIGTVVSGGSEAVLSGGVDIGTVVVNGGDDLVEPGEVASGTVVVSGGNDVYGTAIGTIVSGGGEQFVGSGGVASGTVIGGGVMDVQVDAIVSGSIDFAAHTSGLLQIDGTTMPTNPISGFAPGDFIYLPGTAPDSPISASYNLAAGSNNAMLSLSDGISLSITGPDPVPTFGFTRFEGGGTYVETVAVKTLLDLAYDTYNAVPEGADGYRFLMAAKPDAGFEADAYIDSPGGGIPPDIVIAFRGSNPPSGGWATFVKNWFGADNAFVTGTSNAILADYIKDAAAFVMQVYTYVQQVDPYGLITLTGHSLGGALAQLVGTEGHFPTAAFNAPGGGQLYPQLRSQLSIVPDVGFGGTDINYRVSGDVVSLTGVPMGQTFTIKSPYTSNNDSHSIVIWNAANNHQKPAFANLQNVADYQPGRTGPNPIPSIKNYTRETSTPTTLALYFDFQAIRSVTVALDPAAGTRFVFTESAGSPNFASIGLPFLSGVASYNVSYETGTTWSAYQQIQPGISDILPAGGDGITLISLDASGKPVGVPGAFLFTASFATSGPFSGALNITGIQPTTVSSGQTLVASAGQTYSDISVLSGGTVDVLSGGMASSMIVDSGGAETVSAGGRDFGATIGGKQYVYGAATNATVVGGGNQYVEAGSTASGTVVYSGGNERVHGVARGVTVDSGGQLHVGAGGVASGGRVNSGGAETVNGRVSGGTIDGGLLEVASGGTASGTITFVSGGTLQLDAGAGFTGAIKGFGKPDPADRIDLRGIAFVSGVTTVSFVEASGNTSGTLSVTSGAHTAKLILVGSYVTSQFTLTSDGHGGTLVADPPVAGGGAAQTTFADITPAPRLSGAAAPGNPATFLPGAMPTNEQSHAGQTLFATGPPGGPGGGNHNPSMAVPH